MAAVRKAFNNRFVYAINEYRGPQDI